MVRLCLNIIKFKLPSLMKFNSKTQGPKSNGNQFKLNSIQKMKQPGLIEYYKIQVAKSDDTKIQYLKIRSSKSDQIYCNVIFYEELESSPMNVII